MKHVITSNDTSFNIKYIDDEESHYQLNIPNNDINKKLIENTVFKFEKSGTQTIIMHDDNNVFHLSKMECNYSEFIKIKEQLDDTQKYNDLLNSKITDKEELQQQINIYYDKELDRLECLEQELEQELNNNNDLLQQQIKLFSDKSIADKKDIDAINSKLNNTDSLLQQQMKLFNNKSLSDKKEIDTINSKLNNTDCLLQQQIETMNSKLNNTNNLLQQQIEMLKDKHKKEIDNLKNELNDIKILLQQQMKLFNDKLVEKEIVQLKNEVQFNELSGTNNLLQQQINIHSFLSPIVFLKIETHARKLLSSLSNPIEIYTSGSHRNINHDNKYNKCWLGKEEEKDELFTTLKNIGYNCNNIIEY